MECSAVTRTDESQNICDRQLTLSYESVSNNPHLFHTTITLCPPYKPSSFNPAKNYLINPYWSIIGKFYQEIEILPLKCGKWKLGGKNCAKWKLGGTKLWKVEIRGLEIVESGNYGS